MGVAKKLKRPTGQPNAAKPKKGTVGKASKAPAKEPKTKQVVEKKSARIQNQTLITKNEPKTDVKSVKPNKKSAQNPGSPPQGKAQKASPSPQKEKLVSKTNLPTKNKRSARNARVTSDPLISEKKTKMGKKLALSSKAEKVVIVADAKSSKNAKNKKARKSASKNVAAVAKSVNGKTLAKPTKKITKEVEPGKKPGQSNSKTPSVASKLQKRKRKSVKSPLKKKLGGKIVKSKKSPRLQKGSPVAGKTKKKPSKSQLKLAVEQNRGVVYFSHLPHGFYENELKEYCGQFGAVTGVHVPRSVNGNSKGFAFVEFKHPEVAEVVAETMNNYLMHTRLVKAELVPLERQKPWIFRNGLNGVELAKKKKADALAARTRKLTPVEEEAHQKKALTRVNRLKKKLSEKGINLDFTVVS